MSIITGIFLLVIAGVAGGFCSAPIKLMRNYRFEHWCLVSSFFCLIVLPWLLAFAFCPGLIPVLKSIPWFVYIKANIWSLAWGGANVLCCLCLVRIGFSLTMGILAGVGMPVGILIPMVVKGSGIFARTPSLFSFTGILVVILTVILVIAVVLIAWAGFEREKSFSLIHKAGMFRGGLIMTVIAGIFQVGLSFAFVYSQGPMMLSLTVRGASDSGAIAAVWAATLPGGAVVNLVYPLLIAFKRNSWKSFLDFNDFLLCLVRAALFIILILSMGNGMRYLGGLGASLGFGIYQGIQVVASQSVGIISGEWNGVSRLPKISMTVAIILILVCVAGMAVVKAG